MSKTISHEESEVLEAPGLDEQLTPDTRHPGDEFLAGRYNKVTNLYAQLVKVAEMREMTDRHLIAAGEVLNRSQPPYKGKLEIRWWKMGRDEREPVVVEWARRRDGKGTVKAVKGRLSTRAKSTGNFSLNYRQTVDALNIVQKLLDMRESLNRSLWRIRASLESLTREQSDVLERQRGLIASLDQEVRENLLQSGFQPNKQNTEE